MQPDKIDKYCKYLLGLAGTNAATKGIYFFLFVGAGYFIGTIILSLIFNT